MSWTKRVNKADDVLAIGDEVEAVVLDINCDRRQISLGLRQKELLLRSIPKAAASPVKSAI